MDDVNDVLQRVWPTESASHLEGFNTHIQTDKTWKDVIGRHGDLAFNESRGCLLQVCHSNGLCIMNTFF